MDRIHFVGDRIPRTVGHAARTVHWPERRFSDVPSVQEAQTLAGQVRAAAVAEGVSMRPLCVRSVAEIGGFELIETDMAVGRGGYRGLLQAVRGGFRVCLDTQSSDGAMDSPTRRRRMRFVAAHEIGHSFFFDRRAVRPERLLPIGSRAEERFCNEFACALLLPPEVVRSGPASPEAAFRLSEEWDVSVEVAARALAEWHPSAPFVAVGYWRPPSSSVRLQWAGGGGVREPAGVAAALLEKRDGGFCLSSLRGSVLSSPDRGQALAVAVPA